MKKLKKSDFITVRDPIEMTPGQMLCTLRKLQGLSQNALAELTGIAQENISKMEKGSQQIGRERALVLSKALNIHPAVLLFPDYEIEYKKAS